MKSLIFLLSLFLSGYALADDIQIEVSPKEPLVDEVFKITFTIESEDAQDPQISFNPINMEILSQSPQSLSTRSTFMNGKLTVERKISVTYDAVAKNAGSAYLNRISVDYNGKTKKLSSKRISILKTRRTPKKVFLQVETDKDEYFVGESILARYYLYSIYPLSSFDIKKFPKLNKFLKRFHQESTRAERVELNGTLYEKRVIYTAQLYANSPGELNLDSMTASAQYAQRRQDPFGGFGLGLGFREMKSQTLRSKNKKIKIMQLPINGKPDGFSGLVGKHSFDFSLNKKKFLVNEPIEIKLSIKGPGSLEVIEAPKIFTEYDLEEFESNADLKINKDFTAVKDYEITYLGRSSLTTKPKNLSLSYFDPVSLTYKEEVIPIAKVEILGGAVSQVKKKKSISNNEESVKTQESMSLFYYKLKNTYVLNVVYINIILLVVVLLIIGFYLYKYLVEREVVYDDLLLEIKKYGLDYRRLMKLVKVIDPKSSLEVTIKNLEINNSTRKFLLSAVKRFEADYKDNKLSKPIKIKSKYLNDLRKVYFSESI